MHSVLRHKTADPVDRTRKQREKMVGLAHTYIYIGGPGSSVGIATEVRAGRPGIESR